MREQAAPMELERPQGCINDYKQIAPLGLIGFVLKDVNNSLLRSSGDV